MVSDTDTQTVELKAGDFWQAVGAALPHTSTDTTLPILHAVKLEVADGEFRAVATTRYNLGVATVAVDSAAEFSFLLHRVEAANLVKQLRATLKATPDLPVSLAVSVVDRSTYLSVHTVHGESRFVDMGGNFPPYRALLNFTKEREPVEEMAFELDFLDAFRRSRIALGIDTPMRLRFRGPLKGVDVAIGDTFHGLLMPIRMH